MVSRSRTPRARSGTPWPPRAHRAACAPAPGGVPSRGETRRRRRGARGVGAGRRGQRALKYALLAFLDARPADACDRSCVPGHLTASAFVLDAPGEHVLLTLHPRVGRWVQLGGHCEPGDATLRDAALREATEESGIAGLEIGPAPLHLDVHPVTCSLGVPTRHLDVRYLVRAPAGAVPVISDESDDLRWWPVDALPPDTDTVPAMAALARRQLRSSGRIPAAVSRSRNDDSASGRQTNVARKSAYACGPSGLWSAERSSRRISSRIRSASGRSSSSRCSARWIVMRRTRSGTPCPTSERVAHPAVGDVQEIAEALVERVPVAAEVGGEVEGQRGLVEELPVRTAQLACKLRVPRSRLGVRTARRCAEVEPRHVPRVAVHILSRGRLVGVTTVSGRIPTGASARSSRSGSAERGQHAQHHQGATHGTRGRRARRVSGGGATAGGWGGDRDQRCRSPQVFAGVNGRAGREATGSRPRRRDRPGRSSALTGIAQRCQNSSAEYPAFARLPSPPMSANRPSPIPNSSRFANGTPSSTTSITNGAHGRTLAASCRAPSDR